MSLQDWDERMGMARFLRRNRIAMLGFHATVESEESEWVPPPTLYGPPRAVSSGGRHCTTPYGK